MPWKMTKLNNEYKLIIIIIIDYKNRMKNFLLVIFDLKK